jgi:hypothetical protein
VDFRHPIEDGYAVDFFKAPGEIINFWLTENVTVRLKSIN